ncbi:MAG: methyltransferase domain-containing protein [Deltaproteobacteria bacterium]|nr:MAG: methyltransferase domain-containing protein [Deltaproteobacteria bacterium]
MSRFRIRYLTVEFDEFDIHLKTLRDRNQFDDRAQDAEALGVSAASWPLFGVVWNASRVLAERMSTAEVEGLRILEIGCGIALPSHVLNERGADITASDYNPRAGEFLEHNAELNASPEIPFFRADWEALHPDLGRFDLLIGSDILYERDHAEHLADFIGRHAEPHARVIIVDPGRGGTARFTHRMADLGFIRSHEVVDLGDQMGKVFTFER